jgi:hypothetical protein
MPAGTSSSRASTDQSYGQAATGRRSCSIRSPAPVCNQSAPDPNTVGTTAYAPALAANRMDMSRLNLRKTPSQTTLADLRSRTFT